MRDFRMDRAVSLRMATPLLRGRRTEHRIPILMYHGIRNQPANGHRYYEPHTPPDVFAAHMRYLRSEGYRTMDLEQAVQLVLHGDPVSRAVVLTFDDGYRDFHSCALPVLSELGLRATVFVMPAYVRGEQGGFEAYMSWDEIREAHAMGMEVGSHSMTHARLWLKTGEELDDEICGSRKLIEDQAGCRVRFFSYPYAFPEHETEWIGDVGSRLRSAGYHCAVSTILGTAGRENDPFLLPRLPINGHDDLALLDAKLRGAYDWMRIAQWMRKHVTRGIPEAYRSIATLQM